MTISLLSLHRCLNNTMGGAMHALKAAKTTVACAHLHNLCIRQALPLSGDVHQDALDWSPPVQRFTPIVPTTTPQDFGNRSHFINHHF